MSTTAAESDPTLAWIAVVLAVVSMGGSAVAWWMGKAAREELLLKWQLMSAERDVNAEVRAAKQERKQYQAPVVLAAFDLQSRLWNIVDDDFFKKVRTSKDPRDKEYAVEHTVYLLARWLGWVEIIKRSIRVLSYASEMHDATDAAGVKRRKQYMGVKDEDVKRTEEVSRVIRRVEHALSRSDIPTQGSLCLWRGEQHAIGDMMITHYDVPVSASGVHRLECVGYGEYLKRRDEAEWKHWLDPVREEVRALAEGRVGKEDEERAKMRLTEVQFALVDVVMVLDKDEKVAPVYDKPFVTREARLKYLRCGKGVALVKDAGERGKRDEGRGDGWWERRRSWEGTRLSSIGAGGVRAGMGRRRVSGSSRSRGGSESGSGKAPAVAAAPASLGAGEV